MGKSTKRWVKSRKSKKSRENVRTTFELINWPEKSSEAWSTRYLKYILFEVGKCSLSWLIYVYFFPKHMICNLQANGEGSETQCENIRNSLSPKKEFVKSTIYSYYQKSYFVKSILLYSLTSHTNVAFTKILSKHFERQFSTISAGTLDD